MSNNDQGPWGGDGPKKGDGKENGKHIPEKQSGQNNGGNQMPPELDEIVKKGQEQLRLLMGGKAGKSGNGGNQGGSPISMGKRPIYLGLIALAVLWLFTSFYRVDTSEQSVELLFGKYLETGEEGLNFAPWPIVTKEIVPVTRENTEEIGVGRSGRASDQGLMLTRDENIVDIDYQVVWNINDAQKFLFNIAGPQETIRAVSESVMREIVARTNLTPILTTGKGKIEQELQALIQQTLDSYESGVRIVRVNLDKADPPGDVANAFKEVQAAEQTKDTLEKQADAYSNKVVAEARGEAAQLQQQAEGYRAQVINEAVGEASRFKAVYAEYAKAPEVTRKRLYIETMERVLSSVDKILIDQGANGQGVLPYLPVNELIKKKGSN
jgi:membrane protease subunit HflK